METVVEFHRDAIRRGLKIESFRGFASVLVLRSTFLLGYTNIYLLHHRVNNPLRSNLLITKSFFVLHFRSVKANRKGNSFAITL